jgi:hypothetical protein
MNKILSITPMFLALTLIPMAAFAHRSDSSSNNNNSYSGYQQTCVNDHCAQGYTDGENQAYSDWSSQQENPDCPNGHSNDYCSQYVLGYQDEWNRSIQQNFNTEQGQSANANIKGNNNKVNIEQGQQSANSGGGSGSSGSGANSECRALCSNIG